MYTYGSLQGKRRNRKREGEGVSEQWFLKLQHARSVDGQTLQKRVQNVKRLPLPGWPPYSLDPY